MYSYADSCNIEVLIFVQRRNLRVFFGFSAFKISSVEFAKKVLAFQNNCTIMVVQENTQICPFTSKSSLFVSVDSF